MILPLFAIAIFLLWTPFLSAEAQGQILFPLLGVLAVIAAWLVLNAVHMFAEWVRGYTPKTGTPADLPDPWEENEEDSP